MPKLPWWRTDRYVVDRPTPLALHAAAEHARGVATVKVYKSGKTQPGWGGDTFMEKYLKGDFDERITSRLYHANHDPFAFVMRSMRAIVVDIDGKNGGFDSAARLDLPPTLAETSKSGNGYHLFYWTCEPWDNDLGFAQFDDHIGIVPKTTGKGTEPGVDIRGTGCVFHHATQRWNKLDMEFIPDQLAKLLEKKTQIRAASMAQITASTEDDVDQLVTQHTLLEDLAQDVPAGKRNNTLFALGSKLKASGYQEWQTKVFDRAVELGLPHDEAQKLVDNIVKYGL